MELSKLNSQPSWEPDELDCSSWNIFPSPSESEMTSEGGSTGSLSPNDLDEVGGSGSPNVLFPELDDLDHSSLTSLVGNGETGPFYSLDINSIIDKSDGASLIDKQLGNENVDHSYSESAYTNADHSDDSSSSTNSENVYNFKEVDYSRADDTAGDLDVEDLLFGKEKKTNVVESIRTRAENSVLVQSSVAKKKPTFKIGSSLYMPFKGKDDGSKPTKNAVQAKINREKKKAYISALESEVTQLKAENSMLHAKDARMQERCGSLQKEVDYLRQVIGQDSEIAAVLGNLQNLSGVKISSSFAWKRKTSDDEAPTASKRFKSTGGVCLHVDNGDVSVEFCAVCAKNAKK